MWKGFQMKENLTSDTMRDAIIRGIAIGIILILGYVGFNLSKDALEQIENESRAQFTCERDDSVETFDEYQLCKTREMNNAK